MSMSSYVMIMCLHNVNTSVQNHDISGSGKIVHCILLPIYSGDPSSP